MHHEMLTDGKHLFVEAAGIEDVSEDRCFELGANEPVGNPDARAEDQKMDLPPTAKRFSPIFRFFTDLSTAPGG
jgi:hypothetical protein